MKVTVLRGFPYAEDGKTTRRMLPSDDAVEIKDHLVAGLVAEGYITHPDAQTMVSDLFAALSRQQLIARTLVVIREQVEQASDDDLRSALMHNVARLQTAGDEDDAADEVTSHDGVIDIPADWRDAHHMTRKALAKAICGQAPASLDEADGVIEAEVARREAAAAPPAPVPAAIEPAAAPAPAAAPVGEVITPPIGQEAAPEQAATSAAVSAEPAAAEQGQA